MVAGAEVSWALKAIAPLLAEQGLNRLKWSWRWKLASRTAEHVQDPPSRRVIRRFLRRGETFWLLSRGDAEDAAQLRTAFISSLEHPPLLARRTESAEMREATADRAIPVLLQQFLLVLDPTSAVSVAFEREMRELRAIRSSQEAVEATIRPERLVDELIDQLPPNARSIAAELVENDRAGGVALLEAVVLDRRGPADATEAMISGPPPRWLQEAGYRSWLCLAEIALGHSRGRSAVSAFEQAVEVGSPDSPRWLARAALSALVDDDEALAGTLARQSETAGGDLLVDVIDAVLAREDDRVLEAAGAMTRAEHPDADLAMGVQANIAFIDKQWDRCVEICRGRLERNPASTTARLVLARALLARVHEGRTQHPNQDWLEALRELRQCRDQRREWRGPSHEAVVLACRGAVLNHDPALCLSLGRESPAGEANEDEARDEEVVGVVVHAAIELGRLDVARTLIETRATGREVEHMRGLLAEKEGNEEEAHTVYSELAQNANGLEELRLALMDLASLGVWPIPRVDELRALDAEAGDLVEAMAQMTRGHPEEAILLTRPYSSRGGMKLLAMAETEAGQVDDAVSTYEAMFQRFQDGDALLDAAHLLFRTGDLVRTETEIDRFLGLVVGGTSARLKLQRLRVAVAEQQGRWGDVAQYAQALLDEHENAAPDVTWALLFALNNLGRIAPAVDIVARGDVLPTSADEAKLLIVLLRELEPSEDMVARVLQVGWDFEEAEDVAAAALMVAYEKSSTVQLEPTVVSSLHRLTETFVERFPDSSLFRRITFEKVEDLVPQLKEQLQEGLPVLTDVLRRVSDLGHPQGIIATVSGKSYSEVLLRRAAGVTPAVRPGDEPRSEQITSAKGALGTSVAIDESVLATASLIPEHWREIRASFRELRMHPGAVRDAQNGRVALSQGSAGMLGWDPESERPVLYQIDEEEASILAHRSAWMAEIAEGLPAPHEGNASPLIPAGTNSPGRFAAWIGPIELAISAGVPLLSDDVGQSDLARSEGVTVFGSIALFDVLLSMGRLSDASYLQIRQTLLEHWVVDLAPTEDEIVALAEGAGWRPGPATAQLARGAFWANPKSAFDTFRRIEVAVHREAPESEAIWLGAALRGIARAAGTDQGWQQLAAILVTHALWLNGWSSSLFRDVLVAAQLIAADLERADPTTSIAREVHDLLREGLGDARAASEITRLIGDLEEEDRLRVLRAILEP